MVSIVSFSAASCVESWSTWFVSASIVSFWLKRRELCRELVDLVRECFDRLLLVVEHALQVLHRGGQLVPQAVGEGRELPDALLAVLEPGLDLTHAGGDVADLLDQGVARRPERRLGR